jgi:hypothetical protein
MVSKLLGKKNEMMLKLDTHKSFIFVGETNIEFVHIQLIVQI